MTEPTKTDSKQIVIDAKNATTGRLAAYAAKQALQGKSVIIVNCNEALITGNPVSTVEKYKKLRSRSSSTLRGPFFPKHPERLMKRIIRGMLPDHRIGRGRDALKRIICYNETPAELVDVKKSVSGKEKHSRAISLKEISRKI